MQRVRARPREQTPPPITPTWTYEAIAAHWHVSPWTIRDWVKQGRLHVMNLGGPEGTTKRISDEERQRFERAAVNVQGAEDEEEEVAA